MDLLGGAGKELAGWVSATVAYRMWAMPEIAIIYFPDVPKEDVLELETALHSVSEDVLSRSEPPGTFGASEYLLPAALAITIGQPILQGFLKKIGEGAAQQLGVGLVKAFEAVKRVGGRWHKSGVKEPGPATVPLSLTVPFGVGSIRFMFPADLDAEQMRNSLAQINTVMAEGQAAIKRAEKLRRHDQALVAKGRFPAPGRTGEEYYQRIYVYRPNLSRWVDAYKILEATIQANEIREL
jgi:hypothetical protein